MPNPLLGSLPDHLHQLTVTPAYSNAVLKLNYSVNLVSAAERSVSSSIQIPLLLLHCTSNVPVLRAVLLY